MSTSPADLEIARMQHSEGYMGIAKAVGTFAVLGLVFSDGATLAGAGDLVMLPFMLIGDVAGAIGEMIAGVFDVVRWSASGVREGVTSMSWMLSSIMWFAWLALIVGLGIISILMISKYGRWMFDWIVEHRNKAVLHNLEFARQRAGIEKMELDNRIVYPDASGNLPIARGLLESGAVTADIFTLLHDKILNGRPLPLPQPVPTNIHYAPSWSNSHALAANQPIPLPPALTASAVQSFSQLYTAGALPSNGFLMGYDLESGAPVTANWKQLYSALIGGASGSGKSTLIRSVLAQSALQGGRFIVIDKHFGSGDESLGESLLPLRSRMLCDVAASEAQMTDALNYVKSIGERRLSGTDADRTPIVLIVDETTAMLSRSNVADQLMDVLGLISQETRKVGLYSMCIGQQFKSEIMNTSVRNSFVSMLSCRARRDVARVMSGNTEFASVAENLRIGEAVWMNPNGDVTRIAVPNCTASDIEVVARNVENSPQTQPTPLLVVEAVRQPFDSRSGDLSNSDESEGQALRSDDLALLKTAKAKQAIAMFLDGAYNSEIVKEVWQVSGGGDKQVKANRELQDIIRMYSLSGKGV